jgi:hypothetical protein
MCVTERINLHTQTTRTYFDSKVKKLVTQNRRRHLKLSGRFPKKKKNTYWLEVSKYYFNSSTYYSKATLPNQHHLLARFEKLKYAAQKCVSNYGLLTYLLHGAESFLRS